MKVLFDARPLTIPSPGGVTRLTRSLLQALAQRLPDDQCFFGTTGQRKLDLGIELPSNSQRLHLGIPNKVVSSLTSLGLASFENFFPRLKPDVLLFPNNGHVGRPKLPYGIVLHDLSFLVEPTWFSWRGQVWHKIVHAKRLMSEATRIFAVSDWTKYALQLHLNIPDSRIDVLPIPRASSMPTPGELPEIVKNKQYVLCLGRQDRRKNASCVVAAVQELHRSPKYKDLHLVIVGGYHQPLNDHSIVLPRVDDATLSALYQSASAFLYPSWYEGLGIPLHEAAAFQVPCVASSTSAMPEAAPAGTLFASPAKPHEWALAIQAVLECGAIAIPKTSILQSAEKNNWFKTVEPIKKFLERYRT